MIARLQGQLVDKQPNRLLVDVQGVGYDVQVPLSTFYDAGDPGARVTLRIHTHVREDQIALYGFVSALEHQLFEKLIGISGVGPKVALAVLSGIEPLELVRAIQQSDTARLTRIPGIGRKTAERITLELRDRLPAVAAAGPTPESPSTLAPNLRDDVLSALMNLGYQRPAVEKAVDAALRAGDGAGNGSGGGSVGGASVSGDGAASEPPAFESLLRQALRHLAR